MEMQEEKLMVKQIKKKTKKNSHTCPVTGITGKINSSSGVGSSSSSLQLSFSNL